MWTQAGGGPPRKPVKGSLSLYQGLTRLYGTQFEGLSATAAAEKVAEEVDRQEREDREQFDGKNGREVRTRAMVHIEALLAIHSILRSTVTVHIPGNTPTTMHTAQDKGEVSLIWFHHGGRGYTDSWVVRGAEHRAEASSSDSDSEEDVRDIPWGQTGSEGFWDWEARKNQIPKDDEGVGRGHHGAERQILAPSFTGGPYLVSGYSTGVVVNDGSTTTTHDVEVRQRCLDDR
mmetsp:Transcript_24630/g.49923  ORF Transcript_24630/g.49923 Transcript_24630/m.49923 type:complete len:232 (-) Transcript_24630:702-1397(-)